METIETLSTSLDITWTLIGAALVFFMQAGFAMVETGLTRAKNAGNIIMKNLVDFCIGTLLYWFLGFGIMFGEGVIFGKINIFALGETDFTTMIFQTVFCATSATIVSGAMAERTKFSAYCVYSAVISLIVYPISGHWIWGGGFLSQLGFHDFAGSTAVHMVGGAAAFIGALILGPRIGKFDKRGKPRAILGHSMPLAALGVFILWFAWFGFNGASTCAMSGKAAEDAARIFFTTNLSAAAATTTALIITWIKYKKPDVSMSLNGALAGLVAITAGCDTVSPVGSAIIGIISGFAVVFGIEFVEKVLKVDDPVGAVGVHFINGALGTILVGLFSTGEYGLNAGLFYGGGPSLLGVQTLGVVTVIVWVAITMTCCFIILKKTIGLRVTKQEELDGLDIHEHGLSSAYADFSPSTTATFALSEFKSDAILDETKLHQTTKGSVASDDAIPVVLKQQTKQTASDVKLTKITIITKQSKFEDLKVAMNDIGVTGMTVTQVIGCGIQKGKGEYYRGVKIDIDLLPKIQVDIIVSKVSPALVIAKAKDVLYTGHIGDGKIFVYDVENVIKVRTGETGLAALQGEE